jgi:hypothetical protein
MQWDFAQEVAPQLFPAACLTCFGILASRWPTYRAAAAVAVSVLLLVLQLFLNQTAAAGRTWPLLTASWAVIYTWEMLNAAIIQQGSPSSVFGLFRSAHQHIMSGMQSAHRRRSKAYASRSGTMPAAAAEVNQPTVAAQERQQLKGKMKAPDSSDSAAAADAALTAAVKGDQCSRSKDSNQPSAITIQAFAGRRSTAEAVAPHDASPASSDGGSTTTSSSSSGGSSAGNNSSTSTTQRISSYSQTLFSAAVMLLWRIVIQTWPSPSSLPSLAAAAQTHLSVRQKVQNCST